MAHSRQSLAAILAVPAVLAILTAIGLVSALFGDDLWDRVSWVALGVPIAAAAWFGLRRGSQRRLRGDEPV